MTARHGHRPLVALALVIGLALALRLSGLHYSLWVDEIASTRFAGAPAHLLWSDWMVRETNPPLYYTLLHGWVGAFGSDDVALRLMSVVIGCIGVALVYALGRRVGGAWTGVLAALLVALSAQHVLYSQQVRAYILAYAGAVGAMLAAVIFLEAVNRPAARRGRLALYLLGTTVAVYSHTTLILLPALIGGYVLARLVFRQPRQWRPVAEWIAVNAALLLLWAWWARITVLQAQTRKTIGWIGTPSLPYAVRMTLESYLPWQLGPAQYVVALLAVAAAAHGAWLWRRQPAFLLLPFLALALPVLLYLLSLRVPMFLNRTVYWGSAPFLVTAAAGIAGLRPRWLAGGAATIAVAASVVGWAMWFPSREIESWQGIVDAIQRQQPGATVVVSGKGPAMALQRYCRAPRCTLSIVGVASPTIDSWASGFFVPGIVGQDAASALLARRHELVAVRWTGLDPLALRPRGAIPLPMIIPKGQGDNVEATAWRLP